MCDDIKSGDVVVSTAGRDKGNFFLVVSSEKGRALIVDGKIHKVTAPKKKNVKHLSVVRGGALVATALEIKQGRYVGNRRVFRAISQNKIGG